MLLLLMAGLILCIMLFHYKSKRKFIDLPGAGLQLPLIGHYQVSALSLAGLILYILLFHYKSQRKFIGLPGACLQLPLIGHYQVSCPLIGWSYSVHNALPLQIQEEVYRPSRGWPSAASHWSLPGKLPSHWLVLFCIFCSSITNPRESLQNFQGLAFSCLSLVTTR